MSRGAEDIKSGGSIPTNPQRAPEPKEQEAKQKQKSKYSTHLTHYTASQDLNTQLSPIEWEL